MSKFLETATTLNGLSAELVISALQKQIRRNEPEEACRLAYELYITGPSFLDKVWSRLMAISVEDVGLGNIDAMHHIMTLNNMRKEFYYEDVDQPIFFIHAIRILCASEKDRSSDYLKNIVIKTAEFGQLPGIPDVAYDKHTKVGREMGRDSHHFFNEGAKVIPEAKIDNDYRERYEVILKDYYEGRKELKGPKIEFTTKF